MNRLVLTLILTIFCIGTSAAQDSISPDLQTQLDAIERSTSDIRQLERIEDTDLAFPTKADLEVYLRQQFDEEFAPEEFADDLLLYVGLDLLEPDIDIETVLFDFLLSQVAGFYDPELKAMNVILMSGETPEDELPLLETIFYSHEYVHALQDQHFDLETLTTLIDESENSDYQLAILALIEGDASQVMTDYMTGIAEDDPLALMQAVLSVGGEVGLTVPDSVPSIISDELLFPYLQGQLFVTHLIADGGWDAIDEAFTSNLPVSTEQIYHPERYLAGDVPLAISAPSAGELLGSDWRLAQDTTVGEFYLRRHLETQLSNRQVIDMATGWGGDNIKLYVNDTSGEIVWILDQVWDTPEDATQFADGYVAFLNERFGTMAEGEACHASSSDAMCFTQIDDDHTRITYAQTAQIAMQLRDLDS